MKDYKWLFIYIASLSFGLGGWMVALPEWTDATSPAAVGGLLMILASITAPALGGSIIKPTGKE